jgi:hypothetical protein
MSRAFRCEICDGDPTWQITRRGDVAVSWACDTDLGAVCDALQRDWEITELVVVHLAKLREWNEIKSSLDAAADSSGGDRHG